jgi:tetratricopeptide (TPR) repeat protein
MLETVREYALERLAERGELDATRDRHARAFAVLTADAESGLHSAGIEEWLLRLDADRDNLLAALLHATAARDVDTALALVVACWRWWVTRGVVAEGAALAEAALAAGAGADELRMRAVNGAGVLSAEMGDFATAKLRFEESIRLARKVGADERMARSNTNLANLATYEGDFETAIRLHQDALATAERLGNDRAQSVTLQNLGIAFDGAGDRERGITTLERALVIAHRAADPAHLTSTQRTLARFLLDSDPGRAHLLLHESLTRSHELADRNAIVECLETASAAAAGRADPHTGARLLGAAEALRTDAGAIRQPDEEAWFARTETTLRTALGEPAFTTARTQGADLSPDDAVALALAV